MALSATALAAAGRITATYNGNIYNATTNPGGLASGGHRVNFVPALQDLVTYAQAIVTEANSILGSTQSLANSATSSASTSASAAAGSATAASTSAGNAAASASAASTSASDALAYRNQAAAFVPSSVQASIDAKLPIASKATTAQAEAGTDDVTYMTPAKVNASFVARIDTTRITFAEQDIRILSLGMSELKGDRYNMQDGISDPLTDQTDVASATNAVYAASRYFPTWSNSGVNIGTAAQAITGGDNNTTTNAKSVAFDGNTATYWISSGVMSNGNVWFGQDFGTPTPIKVISYTNTSASSTNAPQAVFISYSDDGTTWTGLATPTNVVQTAGAVNTVTIPDGLVPHRYWRLLASTAVGATWFMAEIRFFRADPSNVTIQSQTFNSDIFSPTFARISVQLAPGAIGTTPVPGTDFQVAASRNAGGNFSPATPVFVGALADGTRIFDATVDLSGQPDGASLRWQFLSFNNKDVQLAGVVFQWRA